MRTKDARMVHWRIKQCAEEMAGAFYELQAGRDDRFYREWPSVNVFVKKNWRNFIVAARGCLATILGRNSTDPKVRAEIYEALTLDGTLPYSIQEAQITNIPH